MLATALVLSGCENTSTTQAFFPSLNEFDQPFSDTDKIKIVFWNGVGVLENVVLTELVQEYNRIFTDKVQAEEVVTDWAALCVKILLDFQSGNLPDIVTLQQHALFQNVKFGILSDLTEPISQEGFSEEDFVKTALEGTFIAGKQYALPFDMQHVPSCLVLQHKNVC